MKYLILLLLFVMSLPAFSQVDTSGYQPMNAKGYKMKRVRVDSAMNIPADTTNNKLGIARIGSSFFVGDGNKWSAVSAEAAFDTLQLELFALQQALEDTAAAIRADLPSSPNELLFGCQVTQLSATSYQISAASYRIGGVNYSASDTTITIAVAGDSARIDVFYVDTTDRIRLKAGTMSSTPAPPSLDVTSELACGFVFVSTDSVVVPTITEVYWTTSGTDIVNTNSGAVTTSNTMKAGTGFSTSTGSTFSGIRQSVSNSFDIVPANTAIARWQRVGSGTGQALDVFDAFNASTGTGVGAGIRLRSNVVPTGSNSKSYYQLYIAPQYVQSTFGSGNLVGVYYEPTITSLNTSAHYAWWSRSGGIRFEALGSSLDTVTYKPVGMDANGNLIQISRWFGGSGGGGGGITQEALDDTAAAIRNYVTENIRYINQDSGIVMTVTGDTAKFSVDTAWFRRAVNLYKGYKEVVMHGSAIFVVFEFQSAIVKNDWGDTAFLSQPSTGIWQLNFPAANFVEGKTVINGVTLSENGTVSKGAAIPIINTDANELIGYFHYRRLDAQTIQILTYDATFAPTDHEITNLSIIIKTYD